MATKTYRARFVNLTGRLDAALARTHHVFVECLRQLIGRYIEMRKGKYGPECRQLAEVILSRFNTFAHGVMDKLSRPNWESRLTDDWVLLANSVCEAQGPLFDQHDGFAVVDGVTIHTKPHSKSEPVKNRLPVPAKFWHQVCDSASAYLQSNRALMEQWRNERKDWFKNKTEWEQKHQEFMTFWNGMFKQFEDACEKQRLLSQQAAGQLPTAQKKQSRERGKRLGRWHLWYEWLVAHPEIIEWRGKAKATDFVFVPDELKKIMSKHSRQDKFIPKHLDWLKENNPELKVLDDLRRTYVRNYLRFKRPPTLTLPSPKKHPYWFTLELDQFYKSPDFDKGTVKVLLIDENDNGAWFFNWFDAGLLCDKRLKPSYRAEMFRNKGRYPPYIEGKVGRTLNRPAGSSKDRKAGYAGAKLVINGKRKELLFTVIEQDCPPSIKWTKVKHRRCSADNALSPDGERIPIKVMAIDLGIRHAGAYAIAEGTADDDIWQVKWLKKGIIDNSAMPDLYQIRGHDRQLRRGRSKTGKAPKGERSFIDLQSHRTNMAQDRFKKAANAIINIARSYKVDVIIFEKLESLAPTAFDERWMNRQLRDMNRRKIVDMVKQQAAEFGIKADDNVSPYLTSHVCSRCFKGGWRFSMKAKQPYKEKLSRKNCCDYGYPTWDAGGHLFRCPHCGYSVNADINAACNVGAKFFGLWPATMSKIKREWVYTWDAENSEPFNAKEAFDKWAEDVKKHKALADSPF